MTFKELMTKAMTCRGMFQSQAEEIIVKYIESNKCDPMQTRWYDDVDGYPEVIQHVLWAGVKDYAAEWIKVNLPEAWFRPMFEHTESELLEMIKKKANNGGTYG